MHVVDDLADTMSCGARQQDRRGRSGRGHARRLEDTYGWALEMDWATATHRRGSGMSAPKSWNRDWEKRSRNRSTGSNNPLHRGVMLAALHAALADWPDDALVADLLLAQPEHRHMVRRIQIAQTRPMEKSATTRSARRSCPSTCCAAN